MIKCSCGRTIEKVPAWITGVQVQFVCTNCPNRSNVKSIASITLDVKEPEQEIAILDEETIDEDSDPD